MKFRKSLIAAMLTGAGVIAVAPAINAAEYSTSVSGNIRVQTITTTATHDDGKPLGVDDAAIGTSVTAFGGEDDESTTGGDTYLQWNHNFANDEGTTTGGGFLRFAADRNIRINVHAKSELGNYIGELKAEWEQIGFSGLEPNDDGTVKKSQTGRDQFAKLTHAPIGVYYKIGREQWLDTTKGYTSDFLSQTKKLAWVSGENRFSAHALGWSGAGIDAALLIQRDHSGQVSARPSGQAVTLTIPTAEITSEKVTSVETVEQRGDGTPVTIITNTTSPAVFGEKTFEGDVSGFGVLFSYDGGDAIPVQADLNVGSGSLATNEDRASTAGIDFSIATAFTQLQLAFPIGQYVPFLNFGSATQTTEFNGEEAKSVTTSGWNLGASLGFGASDVIVAFGSQTVANKDIDGDDASNADTGTSGFDLIWATNQEPLKVSLAYSSITTSTPNNDADEDQTASQYGVRLDFGF